MPVRRLVGVPPRRTGPTGAASPVGPDCARTPRCFGARLLLRGFQGGDLLRQSLGTVSGVVDVRVDRRCRAHEQPCGTHPPLGRAVAQEFLWLPQRGGVSVRGADVDRGTNPAVAETSGARLPVSRDRSPSVWPSRSAITGPGRGLNGYYFEIVDKSGASARPTVKSRSTCRIRLVGLCPRFRPFMGSTRSGSASDHLP